MGQARVTQVVDVSAEAMWRLVSSFGDTSWMPAGTQVRLEGSGPGMTRHITAGPKVIQERLESVDAAARTLVYSIPMNAPFPVTSYRATMRVTPRGAGCELEWSASFTPAAGAAEAEVAKAIEGMYGLMIGWLATRAKAA